MEGFFKFTVHEKDIPKYRTLLASFGMHIISVAAHPNFGSWRTIEIGATAADCSELIQLLDQMGNGDNAA